MTQFFWKRALRSGSDRAGAAEVLPVVGKILAREKQAMYNRLRKQPRIMCFNFERRARVINIGIQTDFAMRRDISLRCNGKIDKNCKSSARQVVCTYISPINTHNPFGDCQPESVTTSCAGSRVIHPCKWFEDLP